jgi:lipopolysaccharide transport system ATP-binding protein
MAEYDTLRDAIVRTAARPLRRFVGQREEPAVERPGILWALNGLSFEVSEGEVVGIIGRNGAGKTTLLKVLSRITRPTRGTVRLRGRVGSLLEVGTGFHPELTGRENVYLNGAILGMKRREIAGRFDDIVNFAELADFMDTPVKRYSSGMYTRLAFSVAAHMNPEILLVDEVLAVGDLAFQKRCLGKMSQVAAEGRTVLFVSHNMQAVRNLCPRTILIDRGRVACDGPTLDTINSYNELLRGQTVDATTALQNTDYRRGTGLVRFTRIEISDHLDQPRFRFRMNDPVRFRLQFEVFAPVRELKVSVGLRSSLSGEFVTTIRHELFDEPLEPGRRVLVVLDVPKLAVRPGEYPLYFWLGTDLEHPYDVVDDLTAPLVVSVGDDQQNLEFNVDAPVGYFSLDSRIRAVEG